VANLRPFDPASEAAGATRAAAAVQGVAEDLNVAEERYGATFADIVASFRKRAATARLTESFWALRAADRGGSGSPASSAGKG
jgi:hypothetical protein